MNDGIRWFAEIAEVKMENTQAPSLSLPRRNELTRLLRRSSYYRQPSPFSFSLLVNGQPLHQHFALEISTTNYDI